MSLPVSVSLKKSYQRQYVSLDFLGAPSKEQQISVAVNLRSATSAGQGRREGLRSRDPRAKDTGHSGIPLQTAPVWAPILHGPSKHPPAARGRCFCQIPPLQLGSSRREHFASGRCFQQASGMAGTIHSILVLCAPSSLGRLPTDLQL